MQCVICARDLASKSILFLPVINILELHDARQTAAAIENLSGALRTVGDLYITSTFMLPPKLGGVLFGLYDKEDNKKYLELAAVGKINKSELFSVTFANISPNAINCADAQ